MRADRTIVAALTLLTATSARAAEPSLAELRALVRPQAGEAQWMRVAWQIDLSAARERAAREDKPLFLWRAGGGDVLGRA